MSWFWYAGGEITGIAADTALGGAGAWRGFGALKDGRLLARLRAIRWADETGSIGYGENEQYLIQLAKEAKRRGISRDDAQALYELADEIGMKPIHPPQIHEGRPGFGGTVTHITIGPIGHIRVQ